MDGFYPLRKYIQYQWRAKNEHAIHSPFVFKLYTEVICKPERLPVFEHLNQIRSKLLKSRETISVRDMGAGSNAIRKVSDIARYSLASPKYAALLFRLCVYFQPKNVLELGTSLGLTTLYLTSAVPKANMISIEGCENTYAYAQKMLAKSEVKNITLFNLSFDEAFKQVLNNTSFDFVYIDGNHTYEATLRYFDLLKKNSTENTVLVFDDIYWTPGMTKAWQEIKDHPEVRLSIDLYKIGLIFFRKENKQKEHFCLRF